jgi:hypothetical protein
MRLQHTTLAANKPSIRQLGLLKSKSKGKRQAVWLHTEDRLTWAFLHTVKRHGGKVENVISFSVEIDPSLLKCSSVNGLFYVEQDIEPSALGDVVGFQVVSSSPLEDWQNGD